MAVATYEELVGAKGSVPSYEELVGDTGRRAGRPSEEFHGVGQYPAVDIRPLGEAAREFGRGVIEDPIRKMGPVGTAVMAAEDQKVLRAAQLLDDPNTDWEQVAEQMRQSLDWQQNRPQLVPPMSQAEYIRKRRNITAQSARKELAGGVEGYFKYLQEQEKKDGIARTAGRITSQMPSWMFDFYLTGGAARTLSVPAKRFIRNKVGSALLARVGSWGVSAGTRATISPHRLFAATVERELQRDEDPLTALANAWVSTAIEYGSEELGETILRGGLSKAAARKLRRQIRTGPATAKFIKSIEDAWKALKPENTTSKFAQRMLTKGGFHGMLGEIGEERVATLMHGAVGTEDYGLGPEATIIDRMMEGIRQDLAPERMGAEAISFGLVGAGQVGAAQIGQLGRESAIAQQRRRYQEAVAPFRRAMGGFYERPAGPQAPERPTVPVTEPPREQPERPVEAVRGRAAEELERRKAEVAAEPAEGPLIAQKYTRMEELLEQFQAEQDTARRDDMVAEMEQLDKDIELLSNLQGKDVKDLRRIARRLGVAVPKGAGKTAIMRLLGGTADLSRIQKTDTGYRVELPLAETEAGRGWTVREFDNFAEAVDFLSEQQPPAAQEPERVPGEVAEPPKFKEAEITPPKAEIVEPAVEKAVIGVAEKKPWEMTREEYKEAITTSRVRTPEGSTFTSISGAVTDPRLRQAPPTKESPRTWTGSPEVMAYYESIKQGNISQAEKAKNKFDASDNQKDSLSAYTDFKNAIVNTISKLGNIKGLEVSVGYDLDSTYIDIEGVDIDGEDIEGLQIRVSTHSQRIAGPDYSINISDSNWQKSFDYALDDVKKLPDGDPIENLPTANEIINAKYEKLKSLAQNTGIDSLLARHIAQEQIAGHYGINIADYLHKEYTFRAVTEGRPVPRHVLEEYKSEKWAQEALDEISLREKPALKAKKPEIEIADEISSVKAEVAEKPVEPHELATKPVVAQKAEKVIAKAKKGEPSIGALPGMERDVRESAGKDIINQVTSRAESTRGNRVIEPGQINDDVIRYWQKIREEYTSKRARWEELDERPPEHTNQRMEEEQDDLDVDLEEIERRIMELATPTEETKARIKAYVPVGIGRSGKLALKKMAEAAGLEQDPDNPDYEDLEAFFRGFYDAGLEDRSMPPVTMHPQDAHRAYQAGKKDKGYKVKPEPERPEMPVSPARPKPTGVKIVEVEKFDLTKKKKPKSVKEPMGERYASERDFKRDLTKYSKALAVELGWEHDTNKKGKTIYSSVNLPPTGGEGSIILWKPGTEHGVYVSFTLDKEGDVYAMRKKQPWGGSVLWRHTTKADKYVGSANNWIEWDITPETFARSIKKEVENYERLAEKKLAKPPAEVVESKEEKEAKDVKEPTTEVRVGVRKAGREGVEAEPTEVVEEAERERPVVRGAPGGRKAGRPVRGESTTTGDRLSDSGGSSTKDLDTSTRPGPRTRRTAGPTGLDYRITEADEIGKGGPKTKFRNNIAAIKLLKQIESEQRRATPEEQAILVKYVGWGGMPQVFDRWKKDWADESKELEGLLTDEEWQAARASTPNAHYTSFEVIGAIWKGLQALGFKGGRINEPSLGIGHFYGLMPDKIAAKSRLHGVELDEISGRIAKQLYQTADIQIKGFEKVKYPDNFFDLFISNVPFGDYRLHDPDMRNVKFKIHDFFFAKAIRKTRPGGLIAFITSRYTLDKKNSTVRDYLAKEADFVGAVRLPKTAFKEIAATEVVTDILIFQKRDPKKYYSGHKFKSLENVEVGGETFAINEYYQGRLGNILGTLSYTGTMYAGKEISVEPNPKINVGERIAEIIGSIELPEAINAKQKALQEQRSKPDYIVPAPDHIKERAYTLHNKRLVQNIDGNLVTVKAPHATKERIKKLVEVRDVLRDLLHKQLDPKTSEAIVEAARKKLETVYTKFTRHYKPISDAYNQRVFSDDPDLPMLLSLEEYDREKKQITAKAKIFTDRTQFPYKEITHVENSEDGLKVSLNEKGSVDVEYIAELSGQSEEEVVDTLAGHIFFDPAMSGYQPAAMYLSGNVRRKLREAEEAFETTKDPQYKANVEALKKVQPDDLKPADINVRLGAGWVEPEVYKRFYLHLDPDASGVAFRKVESQGIWVVSGRSSYGEKTWGTGKVSALRLIELAMNQKRPDVKKTVMVDGQTKVVIDKDETVAAETKQQRIKDEFQKWVWQDAERAKDLVRKYNDLYNDTVFPEWDGSHLKLPGKVSDDIIKLRDHQKNAIWRFLTNGNLLMGHDVGAGKTYAGAAMAMEARRLGIVKKPIFVVPNHLISQWRNSWIKLYPSATLLVTTEKDFTPKNRQTVMNRIATGDWDGIIVPFSSFEKIPMTPEVTRSFIREQIDALRVEYESAKSEKGSDRSYVKELEKAVKRLKALLERQEAQWKKDKGPFFDELGIDMMFIDEAHEYKNLFFRTQMTRVAGVQQSFVQKSFDVLIKSRHINKISNGRGLVFATGTPITNTMAEIFTMQRYLQPDLLKEKGFESFDLWAHNFGEQVTEVEISPEGGGFRMHTRFKKFTNVPALMQMFRMITDIKNKHELGLKLPNVKGGKHKVFTAEASQTLKSYVRRLVSRMEDIRKGNVDPKIDNPLKVTTDGRKAALDMRLIDKSLPDYPGSKVNQCVENVHEIWQKTSKNRDTQLIWCDLGVPNKEGRWDVYADVKRKLIKKGVPAGEIAFIHDVKDKSRLDAFYRKVNEGTIRIVMASSIRMSTGANVQERLLAAHHLDAPWRPADIEQRDGRIIRWGNGHDEVQIYRYVTKGSFDAYIWQTLENKAKFIAQIMTGKATSNEITGDFGTSSLSYAEVKALAAENPKVIEAVQLDAEVSKLQALRQSHINEQYDLRLQVASLPSHIQSAHDMAAAERGDYADYQKVKEAAGDKLDIEVAGKKYTKHKEAGEALIESLEKNQPEEVGTSKTTENIGKIFGFDFDVRGYRWKDEFSWDATIKGREKHGTSISGLQGGLDAVGAIRRMLNRLEELPERANEREAWVKRDKARLEAAQKVLGKAFEQQEELDAKAKKLRDLYTELDIEARTKGFKADPTQEGEAKGEAGFAGVAGRPGGKTKKPWLTAEKVDSPDPEIRDFFQRTKRFGPKKASGMLDKIKAGYRERFVTTPHIPRTADTAYAREIIRTMPEARRAAIEEAYEEYSRVLDGDGSTEVLSTTGLQLYAYKIFLEDFIVEAEAGRNVPGGFSLKQLQADRVRVNKLVAKVPSVQRAYNARQKLWQKVSSDLADRGVISHEAAANPHYVRHFVLHYMESRPYSAIGAKRKKLKQPFRAYKIRRKGTELDVSTDILEVDTHALAEIYADNAVEDAANEIAERYGERAKFTQLAKDKNFEMLVGGAENVRRIEQLRGMIAEIRESGDKPEPEMLEELHELDPTWPFRQRIAINMSRLHKALGIDEVIAYDDVMWGGEGEIGFAQMNAIIRNEPGTPQAAAAAGVFKAINDRINFIKAVLGNKFITPERMAEGMGFVEWHYKRPNVFYRATTADAAKIAQMVEDAVDEVDLVIPKAMLRDALVMGAKRKGWIIPQWMAAQLDDLPVNKRSGYVVDSFSKPFTKFWKRFILRVNLIRYNLRNLLGDSERLHASGRTHAFLRSLEAVKILFQKKGDVFDMARRHGVVGTSLWHEMGTAHRQKIFERFEKVKNLTGLRRATAPLKYLIRKVSSVGTAIQDMTQFREDILRMAVFLDALDDVDNFRAGKETRYGKHIRHWAGTQADVEALAKEDRWRAAAKISRETMLDYGDFTPWENDVLRQGLVPFYSFMKKNAQFWPHAMVEAAKEGGRGKGVAVAGTVAGWNLGKWAVRILFLYALAWLWNRRDDEAAAKDDALAPWLRSRPHLNIGDGTLWGQTALSDLTEWFNLDDIAGDLERFDAGYINFNDLMKSVAVDTAKGPVNKLYQGLNPFLKAPVTGLGYKTFPDVLKPRQFDKAWGSKAIKEAVLEPLGTDVKRFMQAHDGKITVQEAWSYYLVGSMYRDTSPEELERQIKQGLKYTSLKRRSPTTGRARGMAKKGREGEHEILKARKEALKKAQGAKK